MTSHQNIPKGRRSAIKRFRLLRIWAQNLKRKQKKGKKGKENRDIKIKGVWAQKGMIEAEN